MKHYELGEGFEIVQAEAREFSIYFVLYGHKDMNIWFPTKMERVFNVFEKISNEHYWITYKGKRVGGFTMELDYNWFAFLFLIPPFNDEYTVLNKIVPFVISNTDENKPIKVSGIYPKSYQNYYRLGFQITETEKIMIRPTKLLEVNWTEDVILDYPKVEYEHKMIELYHEVYSESPVSCISNKDKDFYKKILNEQIPESKPEYSTLIFDKHTNKLIASCLVTIWEELPYITDIIVKSSHKNKGLGTMMLKKVLNNAHKDYPAVRLAVRKGNRAEGLYHRIGFVGGIESSDMELKK